jgi:AraC-like DNA-binding protein
MELVGTGRIDSVSAFAPTAEPPVVLMLLRSAPVRTILAEAAKHASRPAQSGFLNLGIATVIPDVLREMRTDPEPILKEAGLSRRLWKGRTYRLSMSALGSLLRLCAERANCRHFGLLVGEKITLSAFGDLGSLMKVSETFGEALEVLQTYRRLQRSGAVLHLARDGDQAVLSYLPYEGEAGTGVIAECALAGITHILRDLCGPDWALTEALIPRRAPADQSPHESFFRCCVRFDQEVAALVFPARLLSTRLTGSDVVVQRTLEHNLQAIQTAAAPNLIDELRQILRTKLPRGRCSANEIARHLGLHKRTLTRHLRAVGAGGFRTIADEVRFEVARHLVTDTDIPLVQVSAALDFSEPAAFTRAFQRWSGVSPSRLRAQQSLTQ